MKLSSLILLLPVCLMACSGEPAAPSQAQLGSGETIVSDAELDDARGGSPFPKCPKHISTLKDAQECRRAHAARFIRERGDLAFPTPYIPTLDVHPFLPPMAAR